MQSQILLLRHAEKPEDAHDDRLSPRGQERAAALAIYLPHKFGRPDYIFATRDTEESHRPRLTVTPLSLATGLPIDATFKNEDYADLAKLVLSGQLGRNVTTIICWHHGTMPELTKQLGADKVPDHWGDEVFDRVWRLGYDKGKVSFDRIHQKLLFGDSDD